VKKNVINNELTNTCLTVIKSSSIKILNSSSLKAFGGVENIEKKLFLLMKNLQVFKDLCVKPCNFFSNDTKGKKSKSRKVIFSLEDTLNPNHPLFILAHQIQWHTVEKYF
jgi:mannose/fructose/N-acetylgalactosamine-specific phosphotransferase system component IIB